MAQSENTQAPALTVEELGSGEQSVIPYDVVEADPQSEDEAVILQQREDAQTVAESELVMSPSLAASSAIEFDPEETPGAIPASALPETVESDGSLTYAIPITIPVFRGLPPELAFVYNSSAKGLGDADVTLGVGWNLHGLSSIERTSQGGGVPAYFDNPSIDALKDVYQLDGQELMACKDAAATDPYSLDYPVRFHSENVSASCSAGGQFTTLRESYLRIEIEDDSYGGHSFPRFVVTRPDGVQLIYESVGKLAAVSIPASGDERANAVFHRKFLLTTIRDQQQIPNVISIAYAFESLANGLAERPDEITYGNGYVVRFGYEQLTLPLATYGLRFNEQMFGRQHSLLRSVQVYDGHGAVPIRAYDLDYETSALTNRSRLASLAVVGSDFVISGGEISSGTSPFPPYEFEYAEQALTFSAQNYPGMTVHVHGNFSDFDSDGRDELIFPEWPGETSSHYTYQIDAAHVLTSDPFETFQIRFLPSIQESLTDTISMFRSHDGNPYSIHKRWWDSSNNTQDEYELWLVDESGTIIDSEQIDRTRTQLLELDRDPEPELVNNVSGVLDISSTGIGSLTFDLSSLDSSSLVNGVASDFDGNGLTDILNDGSVYLAYDGWFAKRPSAYDNDYLETNDAATIAGDVNGDGLADLIAMSADADFRTGRFPNLGNGCVIGVALGNGKDFSEDSCWITESQLPNGWNTGVDEGNFNRRHNLSGIRDVDGDGLGDLLLFMSRDNDQGAPVYVLLSTGSGFAYQPYSSTADEVEAYVGAGDFDGNGRLDFVHATSTPVISFGVGSPPNLLTEINTPTGAQVTVAYAPTSDGSGANPTVVDDQRPGVSQVVASLTVDTGRGQLRTTSFEYRSARMDHYLGKSLGFETVTRILPVLTGEVEALRLTTTYDTSNFAVSGNVISTELSQGGTIWRTSTNDYLTVDVGNGPYRSDLIRRTETERYGTAFIEQSSEYETDIFGNQTRQTRLGWTLNGVDLSGADNVTVASTFSPNLASYIVSLPETVTRVAGEAYSPSSLSWLGRQEFEYDGQSVGIAPAIGNRTKVLSWDGQTAGTPQFIATLTNTFDGYGNMLSASDALNNQTSYGYDTSRHLFQVSMTNALSQAASVTWDEACQAPTATTDINGRSTTYSYDIHCREISRSFPGGNYLSTDYQSFGNPGNQYVQVSTLSGSSLPGSVESINRQYFDALGQVWMETSSGETSAISDAAHIVSEYDERGQLIFSTVPLNTIDAQGPYFASDYVSFTYDPLGRQIGSVLPDGNQEELVYGTHTLDITQVMQAVGTMALADYPSVTSRDAHCFDAVSENTLCGEVESVTDDRGNVVLNARVDPGSDVDAPAGARTTAFQYDLNDRLIGVTDPSGAVWAYDYDVFGNRITSDDPDLGLWTMTYDLNGNLTLQTDAKGQTIAFTYDDLNRVTQKQVSYLDENSQSVIDTTSYTYDQSTMGEYNLGQLTTVSNANHSISYGFGLLGLTVREDHTIGSTQVSLETSYHPNGSVKDMFLPLQAGQPNQWVGQFDYDAAGRLASFGSYIADVTYDLRGNPTQTTFGSGLEDHRDYDAARGWLNWIELRDASNILVTPRNQYWRSATGRVTRHQSSRGMTRFDFTYDYAGRLLSAVNYYTLPGETTPYPPYQVYNQSFAYTSAGSIATNSRLGTYYYPLPSGAHPHAPTQVGADVFTYDANGNMLTGLHGKAMSYDGENRPLSVTHNGVRTEYIYGADGSRLQQVTAAGTAAEDVVTYLGPLEIRGSLQAPDEVVVHAHTDVRLVDGVESYLHHDQLGSVVLITDASGAKAVETMYRPFGEQAYVQTVDPAMPEEARSFIGERYDSDAGLQFLNARYYDPELGLFLQPDWFEVVQAGVGTNRYAYSFNDPVNFLDPEGNQTRELVGACTRHPAATAACAAAVGVSFAIVTLAAPQPYRYGSPFESPFDSPPDGLFDPLPGGTVAPDLTPPLVTTPIADDAGPSVVSTPITLSEATIFSTPITPQQWEDLITNAVAPGTYVLHGDNGMIYVGKGDEARMETSRRRIERKNPGVEIIGSVWEPADSHRDAFKIEDDLIQHYGGELGVRSPNLWNRINSPGRRYNEQDGN